MVFGRSRWRSSAVFAVAAILISVSGCGGRADPTPKFAPGEGAISGTLVTTDGRAYELSPSDTMEIELLSPASGVAATARPFGKESRFVFSHVPPGRYELSVYQVVIGKRTIAGSLPVVVNPAQVTPAQVTLTVTPVNDRGS